MEVTRLKPPIKLPEGNIACIFPKTSYTNKGHYLYVRGEYVGKFDYCNQAEKIAWEMGVREIRVYPSLIDLEKLDKVS